MQDSKNKLEKQFYQTFNLSKTYMNCDDCPHYYRNNSINNSKPECDFIHLDKFDEDDNYVVKLDYTPITDSIYMELMVIIQKKSFSYWLSRDTDKRAVERVYITGTIAKC